MQLTVTQASGYYMALLRASNDALLSGSLAGSYYGMEVAISAYSNGVCSATLNAYKVVAPSATLLSTTTIPCHNGMVVRAVMLGGGLNGWFVGYVDNVEYICAYDNTTIIASGAPGVAVAYAPSGNSISLVQLGPLDTIPPNTINPNTVGTSTFTSPSGSRVDFQWQGVTDDANGIGLAFYQIYRNGAPLAYISPSVTEFSDTTVSYGPPYTYQLQAVDFHSNISSTTLTVAVPPVGSIDPRQVGVRPTGSYWGGAGEQIDMRSGNLNFTIPLLKAQGRGGWGVGINLSYNSQNWRQDSGGANWNLGRDEGYGFGWKLLAGSVVPYYSGYWNIHHYVFTDATGAEYRLDQNNGGVWSSLDAAYLWYDSNTQILHFPDGSFWTMGSISAGTEQDTGTRYPTAMEDSNGNQILIRYNAGMSVAWTNSSSRIQQIEDVRANGNIPPNYSTYNFTYDQSGGSLIPPHLTGITNTIGTSGTYTFTYVTQALQSPFSGANYGTWKFLQAATNGLQLANHFTYDTTTNSGELIQATMPYGGYLKWTHANVNYSAASQREVVQRNLPKTGGVHLYHHAKRTNVRTRFGHAGRQ